VDAVAWAAAGSSAMPAAATTAAMSPFTGRLFPGLRLDEIFVSSGGLYSLDAPAECSRRRTQPW
jgi:hypothetical protein